VRNLVAFNLLFSMLFLSCRKEKTNWNTEWGAPIINDTLTLSNLYNDSTLVSNDGTTLNLNLSRTILNLGINDLIDIKDTVFTQTTGLLINLNNVGPGTNFINNIEENKLNIEGVQLKKVIVASGTIKIKVYNPLGTKVFYTVQIPGATKNGVLFEQTYSVDGGTQTNPGVKDETLDLSGYSLDLTGVNYLSYNKLQTKVTVKTDPNGPSVSITTANAFRFDAEISGIKIDYAKGYFGNQVISDTTDLKIDFLKNVVSGTVDIPATSLSFEIENGAKISMRASLTLAENTNAQGNSILMSSSNIGSDLIVSPATGAWSSLVPSNQSLQFNASNSNIEQYIENLGSNNKIGYSFQLNPWGNLSGGNDEIFPNSRIKVKIKSEMPLTIGTDQLTLRDTFDLNLPNDQSKTYIQSGIFTLHATNAFPISCKPILYLLDSNNFVLNTILGSSDISSSILGDLDNNDGLYKKKSIVEFNITQDVAKNLSNVNKVIVEGDFNTPIPGSSNTQAYNIPYGAFLAVKLKLKLNTKIVI